MAEVGARIARDVAGDCVGASPAAIDDGQYEIIITGGGSIGAGEIGAVVAIGCDTFAFDSGEAARVIVSFATDVGVSGSTTAFFDNDFVGTTCTEFTGEVLAFFAGDLAGEGINAFPATVKYGGNHAYATFGLGQVAVELGVVAIGCFAIAGDIGKTTVFVVDFGRNVLVARIANALLGDDLLGTTGFEFNAPPIGAFTGRFAGLEIDAFPATIGYRGGGAIFALRRGGITH